MIDKKKNDKKERNKTLHFSKNPKQKIKLQ